MHSDKICSIYNILAGITSTIYSIPLNTRRTIADSIMDTTDPLFQKAMLKIDDDEFYEVRFAIKAPLGIVFERSGEWAIIKVMTTSQIFMTI